MIGIDTVHLRIPVDLSDVLSEKKWRRTIYSAGRENERERWDYQSRIHSSIYCIYYPQSYAKVPALIIKIDSLARLAFGNNYTSFECVDDAIQTLALALNDDPWIPTIEDMPSVFLVRLDFFGHYQIGEDNVLQYLNVLSKSNYPHRTRISYQNPTSLRITDEQNNGVAFHSKSVTSRFYSKHLQCGAPETIGLLRHEIQFSTGGVMEKAFGVDSPTLASIEEDTCNELFLRDLQILHLEGKVAGIHQAGSILKDQYGTSYGTRLMDLMRFIQDHPEYSMEQIAINRGRSVSYTKRQLSEISKTGISPVMLESQVSLPPLIQEHLVPLENRNKLLSDTNKSGRS